MLSRVANAVYWMSRYLERSGNLARFVDVNWHLTLDLPGSGTDAWRSLIIASGDKALFEERYHDYDAASVITFLCFEANYPNSITSCLWSARENARAIREVIPYEMWEEINITFHAAQDAARRPLEVVKNPYEFCQMIKRGDFIAGGISGDAMINDEAWHFSRMGRMLERCDKTSRILDVNTYRMIAEDGESGMAFDSIQWSALLRATSALNAFRRCRGRIDSTKVADFLLLDQEFPRSVLHGLIQTQASLYAITGTPLGHFSSVSERLLGQLRSDLSYLTIEDILDQGLHRFTDRLQTRMNTIDACLGREFFGTPGGEPQVQVEQ